MAKAEYFGKIFPSNNFGDFKVTGYTGADAVTIEFLSTGYQTVVSTSTIRKGSIKDRLAPSVYGIGVVGEDVRSDKEGVAERPYTVWRGMLQRCYGETTQLKQPTYAGCTVEKSFLYYPTFKAWLIKQPYYDSLELDKDLLVKGNKVYSPDTCTMLPDEINSALASISQYGCCSLIRYSRRTNCYELDLTHIQQGLEELYNTYKEAFSAYKVFKENQLQVLAEKWKNYISPEAYRALISYSIYSEC